MRQLEIEVVMFGAEVNIVYLRKGLENVREKVIITGELQLLQVLIHRLTFICCHREMLLIIMIPLQVEPVFLIKHPLLIDVEFK